MESTVTPSSPINAPHHQASNYDELLMQQSLNFADSLKELKHLQKQLYSAAEYFELSYSKHNQKELVIETFKEYATKALVSTVDHLGSVASTLNGFLEEKVDEVSATKLRFSCIEQRIQTCQELIDLSGHSQQSLFLETPKHHKRYMISAEGTVNANGISESIHESRFLSPNDNLQRPQQAFQATRPQAIPSLLRKGDSRLSPNASSPSPTNFTFTKLTSKKEQGKRAISPFRFSLKRSGSVTNKSISTKSADINPRTPSEPRRSTVMHVNTERGKEEEMELYSRKSKNLLKALLSIHKSKKEGVPSRFRDGR